MKLIALVILTLLIGTMINLSVAGAQEFLFSIPAGGAGTHIDVATGPNADLHVVDTFRRQVKRYIYPDGLRLTFGGSEVFTDDPFGIAVDGDRNIYVADSINNQIQKFDFQDNNLGMFPISDRNVKRIAVDSQGNVYVSESNRILKFDPNFVLLLSIGSRARGSGDGQFDSPWGIAIDRADNAYVADLGNHRIQVFDSGRQI